MSYAALQQHRRRFAEGLAREQRKTLGISTYPVLLPGRPLRSGNVPPPPPRKVERIEQPRENRGCDCDGGSCAVCRPRFVCNMPSQIPPDVPALSKPCILLGYCSATGLMYSFDGKNEMMRPGAFQGYLQTGWPVAAWFAHSPADVLGSTENGLLTLREDSFGVLVALQVETVKAAKVATLARRGECSSMSFGRCTDTPRRRYRLGQQVDEHVSGRASEVSFLTGAPANPATSVLAVCPDDLLGADPWREAALAAEARRLEWQAPSWAMGAIQQARRELGLCRLRRLGAMLLAQNVFAPWADKAAIVKRAMASM